MTVKCTAVVHDPDLAGSPQAGVPKDMITQLYEFDVGMWYEAFDMLTHEIQARFPHYRKIGVDHLEIKAMAMIHKED